MKVNIWQNEIKNINRLFEIDEYNKTMSDFYLSLIDNSKNIAKAYNKEKSFIENIINYFDAEEFLNFMGEYFDLNNNFKLLDEKEYLENPYVKNIKLNDVKYKQYAFKEECFEPYECFIYKDIELHDDIEETKIGYFNKKFNYISLYDKKSIWMLITPHEINTMKKPIENAKGNVITFGLGLGYFAYMCSLKEEVKSVTIIERDENIINLFNKFILPQFKEKEKIRIIQCDALSYINENNENYDYAFVDLYKSVDDGLKMYILMLKESIKWKNTKFDFWIEKSMLIMLKRCLITTLFEQINKIECNEVENYYDSVINSFSIILNDYQIKTLTDINDLLMLDNIKKLAYKL